jgi:hypothetical protein
MDSPSQTTGTGDAPDRAAAVAGSSLATGSNEGAGVGQQGGPVLMPRGYTLTMPDDDNFYGISKEQLAEMNKAGKSLSLEVSLVCAGSVIGYLPSMISTISQYHETGMLDGQQVAFGVTFIVLAVLAVAKYFEHKKTKNNIDLIVARIEAGQKTVRVQSGTFTT